MKKRFITFIPKKNEYGEKRLKMEKIEKIILLKGYAKSHGITLGLYELKKLIELNEPYVNCIYDLIELMNEVVEANKN
jgi:hypothetical protein